MLKLLPRELSRAVWVFCIVCSTVFSSTGAVAQQPARQRSSETISTIGQLTDARAQPTSLAQAIATGNWLPRQQLKDAWWTGPMLAASADTLPAGHVLIEPYVFDVRTKASDRFGSLTYLLYGITDRFSGGLITVNGWVVPRRGGNAKAPSFGDTTLLAQYRLVRFEQHRFPATISLVFQESLPTGVFDRLERQKAAALGSGARTSQLALYAQSYLWLPNGRLLRLRFNVGHTLSSEARLRGQSVYGTPVGFVGEVKRGPSEIASGSVEYSLSREIVLAFETVWQHVAAARVSGQTAAQPVTPSYTAKLPSSEAIYFAPEIEYSWQPNIGLLFALRFSPEGRNSPRSVTPAVALNWVL